VDSLVRLGVGTEEVTFEREAILGFLLRDVFDEVGLKEGLVVGVEGFCSSEDSENTGVPYLKEGSSESEPERLEEEEEISSITGAEGLEVLGEDLMATIFTRFLFSMG